MSQALQTLRAGSWRAPATTGPGLREALHAEWTKLRTTPGTVWLLLAIIAVTVALSAAAADAARCLAAGCGQDPAKVSLTGVDLGQAVVAVLAVLAVSGEYSTGMILSLIHISEPTRPRLSRAIRPR